jgi:hypothetical protein
LYSRAPFERTTQLRKKQVTYGDWTHIRNREHWDLLCSKASGFHDGFIKEFSWENPDFVDENSLDLHFEGPVQGRILIHLQNEKIPTVELLITDVQECLIVARADEPAECRFEGGKLILKLLQIKELRVQSLSYRVSSRP